jgi:hypothetical protein
MGGAVLVAIAASIGNLLQGWDNATIAGKLTVEKKVYSILLYCCAEMSFMLPLGVHVR